MTMILVIYTGNYVLISFYEPKQKVNLIINIFESQKV